jgi:hypothetical protein
MAVPAPKDAVVAEISGNWIYIPVGNGKHIVFWKDKSLKEVSVQDIAPFCS